MPDSNQDGANGLDWSNPLTYYALGDVLGTPVRRVQDFLDGFRGTPRIAPSPTTNWDSIADARQRVAEARDALRRGRPARRLAAPAHPTREVATVFSWTRPYEPASKRNPIAVDARCGDLKVTIEGEAQVDLFLRAVGTIGEVVRCDAILEERAGEVFEAVVTKRLLDQGDQVGLDFEDVGDFRIPAKGRGGLMQAARRVRKKLREAGFPESKVKWETVPNEGFRFVIAEGVRVSPPE